jgi:hypothetical protein
MVEKKNQTMFAAEMRKTFEHLLNYIATESDSDKAEMWKSLLRAESHSFPTHYEDKLMTAMRYMLDSVDTIADYNIGKKK